MQAFMKGFNLNPVIPVQQNIGLFTKSFGWKGVLMNLNWELILSHAKTGSGDHLFKDSL